MSSVLSQAQKIDIDNFRVSVEYAAIPDHCVPPDNRTYEVNVSGSEQFVDSDFLDRINLGGYTKQDTLADIQVFVTGHRFNYGTSSTTSRIQVKKDKDGKVTSRTKYYKVSFMDRGRGYLEVYGPDKSYSDFKREQRKEKNKKKAKKKKVRKKTRAELKKEQEKKDMAANPFLKNVEVSEEPVEEERQVTNPKTYEKSLRFDYTYTTKEYTSAKKAQEEYLRNVEDQRYAHKNKFFNNVVTTTNKAINKLYGFYKTKDIVNFKITDSKKHPENENYRNAMNAVKVIFSKMKYNAPIDDLTTDLSPVINYLIGITEKYTDKSKRVKKFRHSAYENLCLIYYYLDQPDKVIEYGNAIVASEYKEPIGEKYIKRGKELKSKMEFHNIQSRHLNM